MGKQRLHRVISLLILAIILCSVLTSCVHKLEIPNHTNDFYVNDFANVLNEDTRKNIFNLSKSLDEQTGAQIVVVTVDTTNGVEPSTYATNIGRTWGVGDSEKSNGVVILLAVSDREIFVAIGNGLEGVLPDGKTGRLIRDYATPYYSENQFNIGTYELYKAVYSVVASEYGLQPLGGYESATEDAKLTFGDIVVIVIVVLVILLFLLSIVFGGTSGGGATGGYTDYSFGNSDSGGFSGGGGDFSGGGAGSDF